MTIAAATKIVALISRDDILQFCPRLVTDSSAGRLSETAGLELQSGKHSANRRSRTSHDARVDVGGGTSNTASSPRSAICAPDQSPSTTMTSPLSCDTVPGGTIV